MATNTIMRELGRMLPGMMFLAAVIAISLVAAQSVRAAGGEGDLLEANYAKTGGGAGLVLVVSIQRGR